MLRPALLAASALALALPLHSQTPIRLGQTVSGQLTTTDPRADDDSHYDLYTFRGRRGERVTFIMRSKDFDAYLAFGRMSNGGQDDIDSDDDGGGGTDARLTVTLPSDGEFVIRANTLSAGETGAYTLSAEAAGTPGPPSPIPAASAIRLGQTVSGALASTDPKLEDGSYYDLWRFTGRAGERVEAVLRSSAFDAFLAVGRMGGGELEVIASDDDGGGAQDARVRLTLPADGEYVIRANSLGNEETGSYTLSLAPGQAPAPARTQAIRAGQTVNGSLDSGDARADDESYYDAYVIEARAGERLVITMSSAAFDAFLAIGQGAGDDFVSLQTDDDSAGGTDARIEITLPRAGSFVIRANSVSADETGAYTLSVARR